MDSSTNPWRLFRLILLPVLFGLFLGISFNLVQQTQTTTTSAQEKTPQVCANIVGMAPNNAIQKALANPASIPGWEKQENAWLSLRDFSKKYHSIFNSFIFRSECPRKQDCRLLSDSKDVRIFRSEEECRSRCASGSLCRSNICVKDLCQTNNISVWSTDFPINTAKSSYGIIKNNNTCPVIPDKDCLEGFSCTETSDGLEMTKIAERTDKSVSWSIDKNCPCQEKEELFPAGARLGHAYCGFSKEEMLDVRKLVVGEKIFCSLTANSCSLYSSPLSTPVPVPDITQDYEIQNISLNEPNGKITAIDFLPDGRFVAGISRHDPAKFPKDLKTSLIIQKDGSTVEKFDIPNGSKIFKYVHSIKISPFDNSIWMLIDDGTNNTGMLAQFNKGIWTILSSSDLYGANEVAVDKSGAVWVSNSRDNNMRVISYSPQTKKWRNYSKNTYFLEAFQLHNILVSKLDDIYVMSRGNGIIFKLDRQKNAWQKTYMIAGGIWSMTNGISDDLWIKTENNGIANILKNGTIKPYDLSKYFVRSSINGFTVDVEGTVWMGEQPDGPLPKQTTIYSQLPSTVVIKAPIIIPYHVSIMRASTFDNRIGFAGGNYPVGDMISIWKKK